MASLKKTVQETLSINGLDVAIRGNGDENDYISLTDLAREKVGPEGDPRFAIGNWMRLKDTIALLGIWEKLNNPDFKRVEFDTFMGEAGRNAFTMTPSRWITATNAIGIQSRRGRNGGTFAHVDLALDFAAWISPEFRLYVFQEYKRLKKDESSRLNAEWNEKAIVRRHELPRPHRCDQGHDASTSVPQRPTNQIRTGRGRTQHRRIRPNRKTMERRQPERKRQYARLRQYHAKPRAVQPRKP